VLRRILKIANPDKLFYSFANLTNRMEEESNDKRRLWEGSIEDRESSTSALSHLPKITSLKPALWILVVVSALFSLSIHFSAPLLTRYPHENLDFRYRVTVWVFGFHVATDQLVKLLASPAIDRLPGLPLMLIATIASIILRIVLPFMANVAQAGSIISFFIISFGIGPVIRSFSSLFNSFSSE
jgi:hypothetical protein